MSEYRQSARFRVLAPLLLLIPLILAVLQYRWIEEVSRAEADRLNIGVKRSLDRMAAEFDREINVAANALAPRADNYAAWRASGVRAGMIRGVYLAIPQGDSLTLRRRDGEFHSVPWPDDWIKLRDRLLLRRSGRRGQSPFTTEDYPDLLEIPDFGPVREGPPREAGWLILQLDLEYLRRTMIPELLATYLSADYATEMVVAADPRIVIFRNSDSSLLNSADASTRLFGRSMPGPRRPPQAGSGRWILYVRHPAGSLEAVVARSRRRNLAINGAVLATLLLALGALLRYTRRAQRLADLQMQFVAGVSHELRTPLTVMRTAGHNLRIGRLGAARVQQYGALIEQEGEKLTGMVEQVLRFANGKAGRAILNSGPVDIAQAVRQAARDSEPALQQSGCELDCKIDSNLPEAVGDFASLVHALRNVIENAAKHGGDGGYVGVSAAADADGIEIRIRDRGPGVPAGEARHIFEAFYRGSRALREQIHGTGLGLSLVKQIVEAHGGTVAIESEAGKGAEFIIHLPWHTYELTNTTA